MAIRQALWYCDNNTIEEVRNGNGWVVKPRYGESMTSAKVAGIYRFIVAGLGIIEEYGGGKRDPLQT